jgi:hypothetical protein
MQFGQRASINKAVKDGASAVRGKVSGGLHGALRKKQPARKASESVEAPPVELAYKTANFPLSGALSISVDSMPAGSCWRPAQRSGRSVVPFAATLLAHQRTQTFPVVAAHVRSDLI